ncbi:MAG: tRNA (adenosine(37)-N6)-threonylcarbamoyltransferase complex ATPase subunit type 1 TsaE [Bacteroidales bacterium]|nr:tRNA (adenosine(37)-N6)-threonylcarbamoyltransferase complex ATPase subunit type 1 TsaE [Bacteroidales bacterium]MBN2758816.1 tRNA (adenosine(37)-N6)-threonylcarbamoyltransferase complex ATPase subunit type 1 TsaE [Bacteroidales bacterium]
MIKFEIKSIDKINEYAAELIRQLNLDNDVVETNCIAFYGEMGAGKTTFIKAICENLGIIDIASSPSFSLINEYLSDSGRNVFHFDFYRINQIEEAYDIGYEDYFYSNNLCLIEWAEKIESLLPDIHFKCNIKILESGSRLVEITKHPL